MINLDYSGKRRGTDLGRALARLILATAIAAGAAALAAGDGSIAAAARNAFGATSAHILVSHQTTK
jgi:hypothetical protein